MSARISVTPNPADVNRENEVSVSFPDGNSWPVTVKVIDKTTVPPTVVKSRTFTGDPVEMGFTPVNTGSHEVEVTEGGNTTTEGFQVV